MTISFRGFVRLLRPISHQLRAVDDGLSSLVSRPQVLVPIPIDSQDKRAPQHRTDINRQRR